MKLLKDIRDGLRGRARPLGPDNDDNDNDNDDNDNDNDDNDNDKDDNDKDDNDKDDNDNNDNDNDDNDDKEIIITNLLYEIDKMNDTINSINIDDHLMIY